MATHNLILDTYKVQSVPNSIDARVGEKDSCIIVADIADDGSPYLLSGYTARFECVTPAGSVVRDTKCTISGNTITYTLDQSAISSAGFITVAYFALLKGSTVIETTENFAIKVLPNAESLGSGVPENYYSEIDDLIALLETQKQTYAAAESSRATAETARVGAETGRVTAESARTTKETARQSAESTRDTKETARQSTESARVTAESARATAEAARVGAETGRVSAESARDEAESKRVADFAEMEQRSKGWLRYYCAENEYDAVTRKPIIAEPDTATLYFVPVEAPTAENEWYEWMWDSRDSDWERLGTTESTVTPISTDQIDAIISDEQQTGSEVLNRSGLSYLWAKLKAAFAPLSHKHGGADIAAASVPRSKIDATFEQDIADLEVAWDSISRVFGEVNIACVADTVKEVDIVFNVGAANASEVMISTQYMGGTPDVMHPIGVGYVTANGARLYILSSVSKTIGVRWKVEKI